MSELENMVADLIREHCGIGYSFKDGHIDGDTLHLAPQGAAHMIVHALAARSSSEWMPIETAPVGEEVLACRPADGDAPIIASKTPLGHWMTDSGDMLGEQYHPTLWQSLPKVPQVSNDEQEVKG